MARNSTSQAEFAEHIVNILKGDNNVIGLTVGGSWLTDEIDEFSDLDLILVTKEKISVSKENMLAYAQSFGKLLSAFTGEHVGDTRLLICLYEEPFLHVDIKFLTIDEFKKRVENPFILLDNNDELKNAIDNSKPNFPIPQYQWIEDRFWVWIHYALLKIGRGEYFEAFDFFGSMRNAVLGPLLHIKAKGLPRGVRKIELQAADEDIKLLKETLPEYNKESLLRALNSTVKLYCKLRNELYGGDVILRDDAEKRVMKYYDEISRIK